MAEEATTTTTRAKVAKRNYIDSDGNKSGSVPEVATALRLEFEGGESLQVQVEDFPVDIQARLAYHGLSQKIGDSWAGVKGDVSLALENAGTMIEHLMAGTWTEKATGLGPRPSLVADAVRRALEGAGQEVNEKRYAEIREKVKIKAEAKAALNNPTIKAAYDAIKAERAIERADKSANTAKGSEATLEGF
jgi:hypothetical protein